jgi:hypothetical protein
MRAGWLGIMLMAGMAFGCSRMIEVDSGDGGMQPEPHAGGGTGGTDAGIIVALTASAVR